MTGKPYFRFHADYRNRKTDEFEGIFVAVWRQLVQTNRLTEKETAAYWANRRWFEERLPIPRMYAERNPEKAITWYKDNERAVVMVKRMRFYFDIAAKYGVPISRDETDEPGEIIYEDDFQIAAIRRKPGDA